MLQVGEITENTDEDSRSNRRPIELIGSRPASDPRSRIAGPQSSNATPLLHVHTPSLLQD